MRIQVPNLGLTISVSVPVGEREEKLVETGRLVIQVRLVSGLSHVGMVCVWGMVF